jgi:hypothetical protein
MRPIATLGVLALLGCNGSLVLPYLDEERTYRHTLDACSPAPIGGVFCQLELTLDETGGVMYWGGDDIPHCGMYAFVGDTLTVRIGEQTTWRFAVDPDRERLTHLDHGTEWVRVESEWRSSCRLDERG